MGQSSLTLVHPRKLRMIVDTLLLCCVSHVMWAGLCAFIWQVLDTASQGSHLCFHEARCFKLVKIEAACEQVDIAAVNLSGTTEMQITGLY